MAERRSALAHVEPRIGDRADQRLTEVRPLSILQVQAWPDTHERVRHFLGELLSLDAPAIGQAVATSDLTVAASAPGRYLIAGNQGDLAQRVEAALPSGDAAVTDLSHGRAILRLEGGDAAAILQTSVLLDLARVAFPPGRVAETPIHHVNVLIHRHSETAFEVWAPRSFALSLAEWLLDQPIQAPAP
jgi:sarcosine oxidase subunit gamma